jgi:hypothetical protein
LRHVTPICHLSCISKSVVNPKTIHGNYARFLEEKKHKLSYDEVKATRIDSRWTAKPLLADEHVVTYMNNQEQTEGRE